MVVDPDLFEAPLLLPFHLCLPYTPTPVLPDIPNSDNDQWQATPVLLPGKSHGRRSLVGCSPWGRYELDTTERLHFHFSLSHIGEGNGHPLQCSCLENLGDGGAWLAAVYGVAQSRTRLKRLSSSSSICVSELSMAPYYLRKNAPLFGPKVKIFYHLTLIYQNGTIIESWIPGQLLHFLYCRALEK